MQTIDQIEGNEQLIRLLCSPSFYDKEKNQINPDTFDLRKLPSGTPEEYVSLGRVKYFETPEKKANYINLGIKIHWPNGNTFSAYGEFNCEDAREVHEMIEISPLKSDNKSHVGLFYANPKGGYYKGPLPKTDPEILEVLMDLADLLKITII